MVLVAATTQWATGNILTSRLISTTSAPLCHQSRHSRTNVPWSFRWWRSPKLNGNFRVISNQWNKPDCGKRSCRLLKTKQMVDYGEACLVDAGTATSVA